MHVSQCDAQSIVYVAMRCAHVCICVCLCTHDICELQRGLGNPKVEEEKTHSQIWFVDREKVKERHIENSERFEYIKFTCSSAGSPRFVSSELVKLACLQKYGSPVNQRFSIFYVPSFIY